MVQNKSVLYAGTITLQPKLYKLKPEEQFDKTYLHIASILKALGSRVDMVAELTRSANIHYHIVIQFINFNPNTNLNIYFRNAFRNDKLVGFVDFKQIDDSDGWQKYISKDLTVTKMSINRPPIVLNEIFKFEIFEDKENIEWYFQKELINDQ